MPKLIFGGILLLFAEASAQPFKNKRLYVGSGTRYILSEKLDMNTDPENSSNRYNSKKNEQEFNTLFIWQKDKVIRIIFKYESKQANTKKIDVSKLASLNKLLPAFERVKIYYRLKNNKRYDECYCERPGGKFYYKGWNEDGYRYSFKENINKWNKKHNPLADKFDYKLKWIAKSDGAPEGIVFEKNQKRQKNYVNNLPLVFDSPKHDSLYFIKPYYINIYRLDFDKHLNTGEYYELFSTVSLMDDFFVTGKTETELNERHPESKWKEYYNYGLENFIRSHTLKSLFKLSIPYGETSALNFMLHYDLPKQKTYTIPVNEPIFTDNSVRMDTIPDKRLTAAENIKRIKLKHTLDSLDKIAQTKRDSTIKAYKEDCYGHYQFCGECYNTNIAKIERLKRGCPVNIAPVGAGSESNWSYGLSVGNINYFKVENTYYPVATYADYLDSDNKYNSDIYGRYVSQKVFDSRYLVVWQLMSPGIGFWISNVSADKRQVVPLNVKALKLNNKPIKPF